MIRYCNYVEDGKVTAVATGVAVIYYTVYDGYGVPHTESCKVTVTEADAVENVLVYDSFAVDIYTLNGTIVACGVDTNYMDTLPAGIYIVRQGAKTRKVAVK